MDGVKEKLNVDKLKEKVKMPSMDFQGGNYAKTLQEIGEKVGKDMAQDEVLKVCEYAGITKEMLEAVGITDVTSTD